MTELPDGKKSLGQHWLRDQASLEAIVDAANIEAGDSVLEIGPGQGALTVVLLERGAKVVAVELDESLAPGLEQQFKDQPFILNMLSILDFDLSTMSTNYKIVANIPYYLTAHLLRLLCDSLHPPTTAVLLVQKEVAQRVCAGAGDMSILSASVQLYYHVSLGQLVPARLFTPPPKVDSQVLILTRRQQPLFVDIDTKQFFRIVKVGFSNRRKTLLNALSAGLQMSKEETGELLTKANIKPATRAQELSLDDWHRLYQKLG
ncbi:MAG TPA: 16S rRNA (adenine(1518)-N(6)/adenine(1519)-N(6))-dimethyltransferase RsmA [Patescibacteria group bacterium]|nr:16S rRNA (adenine(1518)-N(6)/adenine(1519)-N(6))-dimethyltransferase RsmA [Patescibacteria group bacterium]